MNNIPLYQGAEIANLPHSGNAGLWYDKFCHSWESLSEPVKVDKDKWIATVTNKTHGDRDLLRRHSERQQEMTDCLNGRYVKLQTSSPFVTGLCRNHPVENGFLWHHTHGVPYLPGASVKGLVGAWAKYWERETKDIWQPILGSKSQVGEVIFFDALPEGPVMLTADIMTPHYSEYYQDGKPPGDWINPNPIPFLSVKQGAIFGFIVAPRRQSAEAASHCETACHWLTNALDWIGAGAKTAVGYGRFNEARPAPPQQFKKGEAVRATLYQDNRNRWCGRTEDGQSGTIFGLPPSDVVIGELRTLYIRVLPRNLEFQWIMPRSRRNPGH